MTRLQSRQLPLLYDNFINAQPQPHHLLSYACLQPAQRRRLHDFVNLILRRLQPARSHSRRSPRTPLKSRPRK